MIHVLINVYGLNATLRYLVLVLFFVVIGSTVIGLQFCCYSTVVCTFVHFARISSINLSGQLKSYLAGFDSFKFADNPRLIRHKLTVQTSTLGRLGCSRVIFVKWDVGYSENTSGNVEQKAPLSL